MDLFQSIPWLSIDSFYFMYIVLRFEEHFSIPVYLSDKDLEAQGHRLVIHMFYQSMAYSELSLREQVPLWSSDDMSDMCLEDVVQLH